MDPPEAKPSVGSNRELNGTLNTATPSSGSPPRSAPDGQAPLPLLMSRLHLPAPRRGAACGDGQLRHLAVGRPNPRTGSAYQGLLLPASSARGGPNRLCHSQPDYRKPKDDSEDRTRKRRVHQELRSYQGIDDTDDAACPKQSGHDEGSALPRDSERSDRQDGNADARPRREPSPQRTTHRDDDHDRQGTQQIRDHTRSCQESRPRCRIDPRPIGPTVRRSWTSHGQLMDNGGGSVGAGDDRTGGPVGFFCG